MLEFSCTEEQKILENTVKNLLNIQPGWTCLYGPGCGSEGL